jgi:hypothetical protein
MDDGLFLGFRYSDFGFKMLRYLHCIKLALLKTGAALYTLLLTDFMKLLLFSRDCLAGAHHLAPATPHTLLLINHKAGKLFAHTRRAPLIFYMGFILVPEIPDGA